MAAMNKRTKSDKDAEPLAALDRLFGLVTEAIDAAQKLKASDTTAQTELIESLMIAQLNVLRIQAGIAK